MGQSLGKTGGKAGALREDSVKIYDEISGGIEIQLIPEHRREAPSGARVIIQMRANSR